MLVSIFVIIALLWMNNRSQQIVSTSQKTVFDKRALLFTLLLFSTLAGVKFIIPGSDMSGYMGNYHRVQNISFSRIIESWPDYWTYYSCSKIFSWTGLSYHYWFAFVEFLFVGSLALLFKKFSSSMFLDFFFIVTAGLFTFTLFGSKQTLAMAFGFSALVFFIDKKYYYSAATFILGYYAHPSSILVVVIAALWMTKTKKYFWWIVVVIAILMIFFAQSVLGQALSLIDSVHYTSAYSKQGDAYSITTLLLYLFLFIIVLIENHWFSTTNYNEKFLLGCSLLCVATQSMASFSADFFRLAYYFVPFLVISVTNTLHKNRDLLFRSLVIGFMIFYFLYTHRTGYYQFMWD